MHFPITAETIYRFKSQLENHPIYDAITTIEELRCFMQHHIYSVWDFMSLIKYLQSTVAPATFPWYPIGEGGVRRFINELVLEEESDETAIPGVYSSHFELYQQAMIEIGADISVSNRFVDTVTKSGVDTGLSLGVIPEPSRLFTSTTFKFINNNKPHQVAAALALGREHIIPCMFRAILKKIGVTDDKAPIFHFYLNRHVHLDEDFHAPLSLRLLNGLCGEDDQKIREALEAAQEAVEARLLFWDGVFRAMQS